MAGTFPDPGSDTATQAIQIALEWEDQPEPPPPATDAAPWVKHHGLTGYRYGCRCGTCGEAKRDRSALDSQGLRRCQHCGSTYPKTTGGGTKFCATCIANDVYWRNVPTIIQRRTTCARCSTSYRKRASARWDLCPDCAKQPAFQAMSERLAKHHAPVDIVVAVIDWPYCANDQCGAWLLERIPVRTRDGQRTKHRSNFAIDHDHACCPEEVSCGQCIRGVICRYCNQILITKHGPVLRGLADYLDRHATH